MSNVFLHMYYEQLQIADTYFRTHEHYKKYEQKDSLLLWKPSLLKNGNFTEYTIRHS